jgi:hypothetical protein
MPRKRNPMRDRVWVDSARAVICAWDLDAQDQIRPYRTMRFASWPPCCLASNMPWLAWNLRIW